jgi:ABC-2 type transport system permease protein
MLAAARGAWTQALYWWALLASTAAVLALAIEAVGRQRLPEAWLRVADAVGGGVRRRRRVRRRGRRSVWPDAAADWRALAAKDVRLFLRDPVQWSQGMFFFALLALYFLNLRTFQYDELEATWRDWIAFLNVFSVAAVSCSFASRFLYPQLSLEGHAIWILGLAPGGILRAYAVKLATAFVGLAAVAAGLTALSAHMLDVGPVTFRTTVGLAAALGGVAAALSVGLGAVFLDTRESNPSAIVSSFGGTLNLVLNLGLMLATIIPFGALFHFRHRTNLPDGLFRKYLILAIAALVAVVGAVSVTAVALGARALRRREF